MDMVWPKVAAMFYTEVEEIAFAFEKAIQKSELQCAQGPGPPPLYFPDRWFHSESASC